MLRENYFRVKNTWHQTLQKSLTKETELFESSDDGQLFALRERDLSSIGPGHDALKQVSLRVIKQLAEVKLGPLLATESLVLLKSETLDWPK